MRLDITGGISSFFQDLMNFFRAGTVLGIDIGTSSIKISEVSQEGNQFVLENYGILETRDYLDQTNLALQTSSLDIVEGETARLLETLLGEMQPKGRTALVSIPSLASFVTLIDMPLLSDEETTQSIQYQAKQYIPLPIEQVSVDWFKVDQYTNKKGREFQRVLLVGMPKKTLNSYKRICKEAGLRVVMMELDAIALVRSFSSFSMPTLVVDMGAQSTTVSVTEGHYLKYTSQTDYGGIHLTRAVSQSLDLGMERSDKLKRRRGLRGGAGGSELSTLIMPFLDVIIQEVSYARKSYEDRYGKTVQQIMLTGGGSKLLGIEDYFSRQLDLPTVPSDAFINIKYPTEIEPAVKNLKKDMPITIGLAKRYFTA